MSQRLKTTALAAVALLAIAACGGHSSTGSSSSPAASASGSASSGATAAGSFGTVGPVCGPGDAKGSTDVGVTDTTIAVSTIADVGWSAAPGLLQPIFDSADAFTGWCNAAGGINGRKLVLTKRDSALSNYLPQVKTACTADLSLVGTMGILDDTGAAAWNACGIPNFTAATVGAVAADAKLMVPLNPLPSTQQNIGGFHLLFDAFPGTKEAVGTLYSNGAAGAREQHTYNEAITSIGGKIVYTAQYNAAGTVNWNSYVTAMKKAGVKFLFLNDTTQVSAAIEQVMATQNWYPTVQVSPPQMYDYSYPPLAGKISQNYYVYIPTTPFEAASVVPAMAQYLSILGQYAPTAKKTFFGETGFSAWLLFAKAAKECGSTLTRACILDNVAKETAWTGGGLQGEINPIANKATNCYILMKVGETGYTQYLPSQLGQYDCDPQNAPTVTP
jgi:ABC-type branched-subunit amino acid transport system substrate-binding protein